MSISRNDLLQSLEEQRAALAASIVLTPVDSLPLALADRQHTGFLHGLYLTEKLRDEAAKKDAVIQFGGRDRAVRDLSAIQDLLASRLGAAAGSLRLLAGLQAQTATFMGVASIGDSVMLLSETGGGHFCTAPILSRLGLRTIDLPLDTERLCVDRAATLALAKQQRPDFVLVDRSEGLRYEDFRWLGDIEGSVKIFDASQYVTQILSGEFENPLEWGFGLDAVQHAQELPGPSEGGDRNP